MTYQVKQKPSHEILENEQDLLNVAREISRMKPEVEVTLAGSSEMARGKITEWFPKRHFFTVQFSTKSLKFDSMVESESGLRAFFKANLFTAPLVFKCHTLRRVDSTHLHFRMPEQLYQQQRRGALRVPIEKKSAALLIPTGQDGEDVREFEIVDLSVGGAKLALPPTWTARDLKQFKTGAVFKGLTLKLGRKKLHHEEFEIRITASPSDEEASGSSVIGCKFSGLGNLEKSDIKQFLIEALHRYYLSVK
jgi:c-di-GMP-binding flagellar brake protein YcgR